MFKPFDYPEFKSSQSPEFKKRMDRLEVVIFILILFACLVILTIPKSSAINNIISKTSLSDSSIKVIIGENKEVLLKPILSLSKNDASIKTSLQTIESLTTSDISDKISWDTTKTSINFYEYLKGSKEAPDGGYEYEVILKSKPSSNVLTFNLDTKNLVAYYQPPLNADNKLCTETACGNAVRPENIVGSYAFYTPDGKKVFHLYRPLVLDAKGNKIWGILKIDGSTLTITIDQAWLDKAAYPVVVDPTWGYTSIGASSDYWAQALAYRFTAPSDIGNILSINFYGKNGTSPQNFKMGIFDTSFNYIPNSVTNEFQMTNTYGWYHANLSAQPTITGGTDYYLVIFGSGTYSTYYKYDTGTSGYFQRATVSTYASPSSLGSRTAGSNKMTIYVEYTSSGGDTTPPTSLYGFANATTCSGTNISFSKSSDSDYNGFMVWWNNVAETNQTNATTWYNKSELIENTEYILSTKTFDLSENINNTFQNYTIKTSICETPTPTPTPTITYTPSGNCYFVNSSNIKIDNDSLSWSDRTLNAIFGVTILDYNISSGYGNKSEWKCGFEFPTTIPTIKSCNAWIKKHVHLM